MLRKKLYKYRHTFLALLATILFGIAYGVVFNADNTRSISSFQERFRSMEMRLNRYVDIQGQYIKKNGKWKGWTQLSNEASFDLNIYHKDSLVYWNTNQLPIHRFADLHFPGEGVIHLQNGWYFAKTATVDDYVVCGSFLIQHDFSYQNADLENTFVEALSIPINASISLDQEGSFAIYSADKKFLFSLIPNEYQPATENESIVLMLMLLASICLWLYVVFQVQRKAHFIVRIALPLLVIGLRIASLKGIWFGFMHDTAGLDPSVYGSNEWFPNFFEYLVNCALLVYLLASIRRMMLLMRRGKWLGFLLYGLNIFMWAFLLYLNQGLIENASIPLIVDRLFAMNVFSFLAIMSLGVLFYAFFLYAKASATLNNKVGNNGTTLAVVSFFMGISYFFYEINYGYHLFFAAVFPLIFLSLLIYQEYREGKSSQLVFGLLYLMLFSLVTAFSLSEFNFRKEKGERELYANQLANERDVITEVEYNVIANTIEKDPIVQRLMNNPFNIGLSDFEGGLERRIFKGFWERYEMGFYLFDTTGVSLIQGIDAQKTDYSEFNELITEHGDPSEIDPRIVFIKDFSGQYSYIIHQRIKSEKGTEALFISTLKSKKIPEEIGFPRLLISSQAKVLASLENYSVARYHNGRLITKYGDFNYPAKSVPLRKWKKDTDGYYNYDGYNHFVLRKSNNDLIVLSTKNTDWVTLLTSFSYLFGFFGILLLPLFFRFSYTPFFNKTLSLAVKIQLLLIGLVFLSLLAFGWGSGVFVSNQYNEYTNEVISEKLVSVEIELRGKIGNENAISIAEKGNYLETVLQRLSKVFFTDINIYSTDGFLLASSRPKVFNSGLIGEHMNPQALYALKITDKSEFIHQESIGQLNYASAYLPLYNNNGKLIGYSNLQHFGQQTEFENQIQQFLVSIINVFMLLLAITIVLAIFISSWVTAPLRLLQDSFARMKFGTFNQQIDYEKDDEIGALVKDYNQKLLELEFAAEQLARSERESAWREMAKQVAHEIKNPLTPMKLSVQQLLRVYDPNDPASEDKLKRVVSSIIEQIDALTHIANEFSSFAKMPRPHEEVMDLLPLIENVLEVFRQEGDCYIELRSFVRSIEVRADKDQMLRLFNNLLKNAIQAIPDLSNGAIIVTVELREGMYSIEVKDNGSGIPEERRAKIFVPYFTTKSTGTGLGLAMVRQIAENHGGSVSFESETGVGTSFIVSLPKNK
jgi:signal transduction histidine kinase